MNNTLLLQQFDLLATAPGGVARLRELILTLAVQGKLVPQDPADEPASELLKRIRAEKDRLIAEGKIKRDKPLAAIGEDEQPFELPVGWKWVRVADVCSLVTDGEHATPERCDDPSAVPLVTAKNVRSEAMDYRQTDFVPRSVAEQCWRRCKPQTRDILMVSVGATLGRLAVLREPVDMVLVRSVTVLRPVHDAVEVAYLALHLMAPATQEEIWTNVKQSAQPCLYLAKSAALTIALPPLPEQVRIVTRVEELMRVCDALEAQGQQQATHHRQLVQTLLGTLTDPDSAAPTQDAWQRVAAHFDTLLDRPSAVDALEQTILQLAVRGQLVPQDPNDEPASAYVARLKPEPRTKRAKDIGNVLNDADAEWLPRGWCVTNVASIAECLDYMRKPVKKDDRNDARNAVPYYGANGQVGWIDDYIFDEDLVLVVEDETFIGRTKPFSYIVQGKSWVNNHAHVLRPLGGMSVGFLNLCLQKYDFIPLTSGTTNRRKLTKAGLLAAEFPLPPLPEQARIVARVAHLRSLCADLRQRLTQSQATQAALAEALVATTF